MIATVPYFRPRGTPLSIYFRLQALRALGHSVDLVCYPIGDRMGVDGVQIFRPRAVPGIRSVGIGPSLRKIVLDALVQGEAKRRLSATRYDLVHSHEEASFFAGRLARRFSVPHLYDMHSLLSEQLRHYGAFGAPPFRALFSHLEQRTITDASAVIVISPALLDAVRRINPAKAQKTILIENTIDASDLPGAPSRNGAVDVRSRLGLARDRIIALYTGSLEPYQGIDLLMKSAARAVASFPGLTFVIVGGEPAQVSRLQRLAVHEHVGDHCVFTGTRPIDEIHDFIRAADILLSPRADGANTPSKIYSYMKSGKPIVATDLPTHRQVLHKETSLLTPKDPGAFSDAIVRLARDPELRGELGRRARTFAAERYTFGDFVERTRQALDAALR